MISKEALGRITTFLCYNVYRNGDIMFGRNWDDFKPDKDIKLPYEHIDRYGDKTDVADLVDIVATLHNLLYEQVTGERFDYAFHHANKIGCDLYDDIFDEFI